MLGGGVHNALWRAAPTIGLRDGGCFLLRESRHTQGPGENCHSTVNELDLQERRVGKLLHCDRAPEATFDFEISTDYLLDKHRDLF